MDDAPPLFAIPITVGTPPVDVAVRGQGSAVAVSSSDSNDLSVGTVEKGDAIGNGGGQEALDEIGHPTRIDLAGRAGNGVVEPTQGSFIITAPSVDLAFRCESNVVLSSCSELCNVSVRMGTGNNKSVSWINP